MTSTEPLPAPAPTPVRRLRRSTTDRVGAGVAGGLGEYFHVDPILFRVGFAVGAFFGGAGVLAYLVAWAVIPVDDSEPAPVDRWMAALRDRRLPAWLIAVGAAVLFWALAFSWWWPHPAWPLLPAAAIALVFIATRDGWRRPTSEPDGRAAATEPLPADTAADTDTEGRTVGLTKASAETVPAADRTAWLRERRAAARERRRRSWPLRVGALATLIVTLTILGIVDASSGIRMSVYFWVLGGVSLAALVLGMLLRRTPFALLPLVFVGAAGTFALAGSHASFHDGIGEKTWVPVSAGELRHDYRLAIGQSYLDLRSITFTTPTDIDLRLGVGEVRIRLPKALNATVVAEVHAGEVSVDGEKTSDDEDRWGPDHGGLNVERTVPPLAGATGPAVRIHVDVAAGHVSVDRT